MTGPAIPSRPARWARAAWPGPVRARPTPPPPGFAAAWSARDLFRLAQIRVDMHRRLLNVAVATPPAIMHWTTPLPLAMRGAANVYTIHDLIPMLHPGLTDTDPVRYARILGLVAARASHIVTVSEASRADIVAQLGVPPDRVTVTYQPLDLPAAVGPPPRTGHMLFCGTIEPRKNLLRLIAAHRASGTGAPLILAGPDGWRAGEQLQGAPVRPLEEQGSKPGGVWRAPWLPRPALLDLLRGARALLFPSLAEGFGLPIAEAMALGVPVLTSAGGATAEIAGGAALLVDPTDAAAIAAGITALDHDGDLRGRLIAAGLQRAAAFTPEACMRRLAPMYDVIA